MALPLLLLIEDDAEVRTTLTLALADEGYRTIEAEDGTTGIERHRGEHPDMVLLDLRLPDLSGFEVCRRIRAHSPVPIIIVTAFDDTHDLVAGLEAGADDYVTKPVEPKALAARIRALLRRVDMGSHTMQIGSPPPNLGDFEIREQEAVVMLRGAPVELTKTEFRLMCEFAAHSGQVLSREQLLERVWGYDYFGDSRIVDSHIRRLRLKIEPAPDDPTFIQTVRGLGYKFSP